ncbi:DUF4013 domain-containing protein [Slackia piriformis]|uniref:DUF4013 domain-containing protein n=1 Tax=Slackia piriformis TaxID=626934 RepID=UPI0023EF8441|nr:DUF4013 domain-containing protein [Slackia piriformis]
MQQGYFSRSWEAFRSTEGWFAKICVLALVAFIPILGPIVVSGYLLGWARDAAWGMDNPLPRKVFGNEDGRLYRRGLFAWIISLVMGLAVFVVVFVCMSLFGLAAGVFSTLFDGAYAAGFLAIPATIGSFGIGAVSLVVSFAAQFFIWIGCMRMSIYDTLSAGFQIGQIWSMIKRDPVGLLKIFLYELVASLLIGVVLAVIWTVLVFVGMIAAMVFVGAADLSGMAAYGLDGFAVMGAIAAILLFLAVVYVSMALGVVLQALVYRSLGYWMAQLNVAAWGSQYDPLPPLQFDMRG